MWSMTRTSTGPLVDSSLSPSCSFKAAVNVGSVSSLGGVVPGSLGVHSILKLNVPLRPVRSNTGRFTPARPAVGSCLAIRLIGTFFPPTRKRLGALAGSTKKSPQELGGNWSLNADVGGEGAEDGGGAAKVVVAAHDPSSV